MTQIYRTFSMDYTSERHHAQRKDGQWFYRYQFRDPRYGYKWSAWKRSTEPQDAVLLGERKIRLPA